MKTFYTFCFAFLLIALDCRSETSSLISLDVDKIASELVGYSKENGCGTVTFKVTSPVSQVCDLSFSFLPGEYADGSFTSVSVKVNGTISSTGITASSYGWKNVRTSGNEIALNAGDNIVSFVSGRSDIPVISNLSKYNPLAGMYGTLSPAQSFQALQSSAPALYANVPPVYDEVYPFEYELDLPYYYTPCIALYLEAGDRVSLYAPGSWDYTYGPDASTVDFNVYLFHENPDVFSVSTSSSNKAINSWDCEVPETGVYNCLIESSVSGTLGGVTVFINGVLYRHLFVSKTSFISCPAYIPSEIPGFHEGYYNIFTANLRGNSYSAEAPSPRIWLKKPGMENGGYVVCAYGGSNTVPSDFDWGNNARVRHFFGTNDVCEVSLSSSYCQYYTADTCDFYYSRLYNLEPNTIEESKFSLRLEDAIVSDFMNPVGYNCIAWSAGTVYEQVWPSRDVGVYNIMWYDSLYNNQTVHTRMGTFRRPSGSVRYTRIGATAENSVVDLWGIVQENGDTLFTHASVRGGVGEVHGYDWESKIGSDNLRIFHPRYSLAGSAYGTVVAHYKVAEPQSAAAMSRSVCEAIADGDVVLETVTLTDAEKSELKGLAMSVGRAEREEFEELFGDWLSVSDTVFSSNMWDMKENAEYESLLGFAESLSGGEFLVFDKFADGCFEAMLLVQDMALNAGGNEKARWNGIMYAERDGVSVSTQKSKVNMYIKGALPDSIGDMPQQEPQAAYSNTDNMEVSASSGRIKVAISLERPSRYSIRVISLNNNMQYGYTPQRMSAEGGYEFEYQVPSGHYIVAYTLNGNLNCKKIIVD